MIITNSKGQRKEISDAEARLIKKQGISPDQFFELFPNEDNTNFAGMNIVDYDAFIDSDFRGIEEEPPPRVPRGVGGSQGKGYPTEEAMKAMEKERQFQVEQELSKFKRDEDKLALEQYLALRETEQTSALTSDLYKIGLGVEAVAMIMAPMFTVEKVAAETIKDVFAYGTKSVKDVTKPRIYTPRAREEVMRNLEKFAAAESKKPGFEPLAQYTKRGKTYLPPDDFFWDPPPSATRKYAAAKNAMESKLIRGIGPRPTTLQHPSGLKYDNLSSYHQRYLPRKAFEDISYQTKDVPVPVRGEITVPAVREAAFAKEAAALLLPFVGSYMSMEDADATGQEAIKRQQALYESVSPEVKKAIDKINAGGIETTALESR